MLIQFNVGPSYSGNLSPANSCSVLNDCEYMIVIYLNCEYLSSSENKVWIFFTSYFFFCSSSVLYCEDRFHIHVFIRSSNIWLSYIHSRLFTSSRVYLEPTLWPAPNWFVSSVGRALHRYRRGHGFKSLTGLKIFQALFSLLLKQFSLLRRSLSYSWSVLVSILATSSLRFF